MAFDVSAGINAAKMSFFNVGLPMMLGSFAVALIVAIFAAKSN